MVYIDGRVSLNMRSDEDEHEKRKGRARSNPIAIEEIDFMVIVSFKFIGMHPASFFQEISL
jgi:hypothetical protein